MAAEIEQATTWIDAFIKAVSAILIAGFGWVWRTERSGSELRQRQRAMEERMLNIEKVAGSKSDRLDDVAREVSEMRGELNGIAKGVDTIQSWIMDKAD